MSKENNEENRNRSDIIYNQDCEFYRHQNELKWQRFNTAAVLEAGILYGLFVFDKDNIKIENHSFIMVLALIFVGIILVFLLSFIVIRDLYSAERFLGRIKEYEENVGPGLKELHKNIFLKIIPKGNHALGCILILLNILNVGLLISYFLLHW
jgi:hypothetical protein